MNISHWIRKYSFLLLCLCLCRSLLISTYLSLRQEVMGRASSQLYLATGSRAFFRNVAVVVPASWSSSRCPGTLNFTAAPPISPAFIVAQPHPVYAHAPWTLQVGGCGQPGRNIFFTPRYLAETNYTEALGDPGRLQMALNVVVSGNRKWCLDV